MDSLGLPQKNDYPEGLNILNDPHSKYYAGAVEASASAYFSSSTLIKKLFYKRLETTIAFLTNSFPTNSFPTTPFLKYNNILDAGTGIGILLPFLSKISRKVKAIDYSDIINYAEAMCLKNKIKNVSF